jgi:LysR family hydrogen peroxide-inducible transcriptional activator
LCRPGTSVKVDESYRATSLGTLAQLVGQSFGCTFLPDLACRSERRTNAHLKTIPFASSEAFRDVGLVWRRGYPRGRFLESIAEFVRAQSHRWFDAPK